MVKKPRVILDTNIIVSAVVYKGKPRQILDSAVEEKIEVITSHVLSSELQEVLSKKFSLDQKEIRQLLDEEIKDMFEIVQPKETLRIVRDDDDNRVLEAAAEGKCDYIVTGDRDLLDLKQYKKIKIVKPAEFLKLIEPNGK